MLPRPSSTISQNSAATAKPLATTGRASQVHEAERNDHHHHSRKNQNNRPVGRRHLGAADQELAARQRHQHHPRQPEQDYRTDHGALPIR